MRRHESKTAQPVPATADPASAERRLAATTEERRSPRHHRPPVSVGNDWGGYQVAGSAGPVPAEAQHTTIRPVATQSSPRRRRVGGGEAAESNLVGPAIQLSVERNRQFAQPANRATCKSRNQQITRSVDARVFQLGED